MRVYVIFLAILILAACSSDNMLSSGDHGLVAVEKQAEEYDSDLVVKDITFTNFTVPEDYSLLRSLQHEDGDVSYRLYEYEIPASLRDVDHWIRSQSTLLGGSIVERYSYDLDNLSLNIIIQLPTKEGTRILSTYTPKYGDKQHLIIEETVFQTIIDIDENYEDHALIIYTPNEDGTTKEIFKGMYPHQHTDIYVYYFYSQAFMNELKNAGLHVNGTSADQFQYQVGYFDPEGNEVDAYSITEEMMTALTFGIQLQGDIVAEGNDDIERILYHWAKTLMLGDKAQSVILRGDHRVNFLVKGEVIKVYSLHDLMQ